jgi:hypothetical protein
MLASLRGPRVAGPMAPELPIQYAESSSHGTIATVSVSDIKKMARETDEGVAATH